MRKPVCFQLIAKCEFESVVPVNAFVAKQGIRLKRIINFAFDSVKVKPGVVDKGVVNICLYTRQISLVHSDPYVGPKCKARIN